MEINRTDAMFNFLMFIAMPLLLFSVFLGWMAQSKPSLTACKVLVGQLMIDSLVIALMLMIFFEQWSMVFLIAATVYGAITSLRLRELFSRLDKMTKNP